MRGSRDARPPAESRIRKETASESDQTGTSLSTSSRPTRPNSRSRTSTPQVEEIIGRYSGTLEKTDNWGRRKLAYEIGPHKEGTYVLEHITGSGELMKEIDRRLRVSDQVIRHITVRVDEENKVIERARAVRKEGSSAAPRGPRPAARAAARRRPAAERR